MRSECRLRAVLSPSRRSYLSVEWRVALLINHFASTYAVCLRVALAVPVIPIRPTVGGANSVLAARLFGWSVRRTSEVLKYIIRDRGRIERA